MALLQYSFGVIGQEIVYRALAGIEARFVRSAKLMELQAHRTASGIVRETGGVGGVGRGLARTGAIGPAGPSALARQASREAAMEIAAERRARMQVLRAREIAQRREQASWDRIRQRGAAHSLREQRRLALREQRVLQSDARSHARAQHQFRRTVFGAGAGGAGKALRAVGSVGAMALGIGGSIAVAGAVQKQMSAERQAAVLANQAFGTEAAKGQTRAQLAARIGGVAVTESIRTGIGKEDVIKSMAGVQAKAGNIDVATTLAPFMTDLSQALGADLGDIGDMVGMTFGSLQKSGYGAAEALQMTQQAVAILAEQGKIGSIEIKDFASQVGPLLGAMAKFEGDPMKNMSALGALAQLSAGTEAGGSAEEAMTALRNLSTDIITSAKTKGALTAIGVDPFSRQKVGGKMVKGALKSPIELMKEILVKSGGDLGIMTEVFGMRAAKLAGPLATAYRGAGGGKKGLAAIDEALRQSGAGATGNVKEIQESAAFARGSAQGQFDIAMAKFNDAIGSQLLPVITKLIPKFVEIIPSLTKLAEAFVKLAGWVLENPLKGLGAIVGASVVKEIAVVGIGAKLAALFAGKPGVPGVTPAVGGSSGKALPIWGPLAVLATGLAIGQESGRQSDIRARIAEEERTTGKASDVSLAQAKRSMSENMSPIVPIARMLGLVDDPTMLQGGGMGSLAAKAGGGEVKGGKDLQLSAAQLSAAAKALADVAPLLASLANVGGGTPPTGLARPNASPTKNR